MRRAASGSTQLDDDRPDASVVVGPSGSLADRSARRTQDEWTGHENVRSSIPVLLTMSRRRSRAVTGSEARPPTTTLPMTLASSEPAAPHQLLRASTLATSRFSTSAVTWQPKLFGLVQSRPPIVTP